MNEERDRAAVQRLISLVATHLEEYLEGDELALEALGECIEQGNFSVEELQAAILTLRSLGGEVMASATVAVDDPPGKQTQRVLGAHERESLSPEAWGYLLALRRRGALDPAQFERVLDQLTSCGVRPVDIEMVQEVAALVALRHTEGSSGHGAGEGELTH
jgi:uncharacterized protein Smg (DUF494 family)